MISLLDPVREPAQGFLQRDWQIVDPYAYRVLDGVGNGSRNGKRPGLTYTLCPERTTFMRHLY